MKMQTLALFFLAAVAMGGVAWVFLYPLLSGQRQAEKRRDTMTRTGGAAPRAATANARTSQKARREQVEDTLKELEAKAKKSKRAPLQLRISQAGLSWSNQKFYVISGIAGVIAFLAALFFGMSLVPALSLGLAGAFGLPRWVLGYLKTRREKKFLLTFPDAVDVIVRGIKAGLPLLDCLKVISVDAAEPTRSEFKAIVATQSIGMPIGEACAKLYDRMPLPEANFFGIVIAIQTKAGGNLSEALGNLSKVLRERKKMKAKITAMSMEAKASAMIIGALPICVAGLVYLTSPDYIVLLFTHPTGHFLLAVCAVWMSIGIFVMKKMINFDF